MLAGRFALLILPLLAACAPDGQAEISNGDTTDRLASGAAPQSGAQSPPVQNAPPDSRSRYTSIGESECSLIEENLEEGFYWRRRCPGHAGYALERSEGDGRQDLVVISPDGSRSQLRLSTIVAKGSFNILGDTAEWRGRNPAEPEALIVRMNVTRVPEPDKPDISNLVVVRLTEPVCAVAIVPPAPGQNERARAIADGRLGDCLKMGSG
jgi:hypothetical protein